MITIRGNRAKSTGKCWKDTVKENVITTWQENVITTRIKGAKSVGKWRKPERLLGTNYDDAVNMLEKDSESAGKCDNNQRKWCKNDRKLKETGKTLGKIYMKCRKREEMVQKAIEESGENGRKHVIKKLDKTQWKPTKEKKVTTGNGRKSSGNWKKSCDNIRKTVYKLGNACNN